MIKSFFGTVKTGLPSLYRFFFKTSLMLQFYYSLRVGILKETFSQIAESKLK